MPGKAPLRARKRKNPCPTRKKPVGKDSQAATSVILVVGQERRRAQPRLGMGLGIEATTTRAKRAASLRVGPSGGSSKSELFRVNIRLKDTHLP